jgi:hypothetical protein
MYPELSAYLAAQFRAFNEDINVERFNISKYVINSVYLSVLCANPDIFYVNPKHFNSTSHQDDDILVSIRPIYLFDVEDIPAEIEEFNFAADHFLDGIVHVGHMLTTHNRQEFIAAHTNSGPYSRKSLLEKACKDLNEFIAFIMAILVIYHLQAIHVDTHKGVVAKALVQNIKNLLTLGSIE